MAKIKGFLEMKHIDWAEVAGVIAAALIFVNLVIAIPLVNTIAGVLFVITAITVKNVRLLFRCLLFVGGIMAIAGGFGWTLPKIVEYFQNH